MTKRHLIWYEDPGHAWLAVPLSDLLTLKISQGVSRYSYVEGDTAFLEEDCDASLYLTAAKARGWNITTEEIFQDPTPIRYYNSYIPM